MYKTLYKRNTNGSIQQWSIITFGDKYETTSGRQFGVLTTSAPTQCKPRNNGKANATNAEEQCLLEAAALYKKKLESGYVEDITQLDETGLLKPMLAKEYKQYKDKIEFPVISDVKIDGLRCNALESGLFSRNGKPFVSCPHILEALQPAFAKYPEYVFDAELYNIELKHEFNKIVSLVKKVKPTKDDLLESAKLIKFYMFDIFRKDGKEVLTAIERKKLVDKIVLELDNPSIVSVGYEICNNHQELDAAYAKYLSEGAEGQMINDYNAIYFHSRSKALLKRKEFQDAEFKILDIISGKGAREGAAVLVLQGANNQTFQSSLTGTVEYMQDVYQQKDKYIGKSATVKFQDYTPLDENNKGNLPRFPTCISLDRSYE